MKVHWTPLLLMIVLATVGLSALAADNPGQYQDMTLTVWGLLILSIFVLAYIFVILEDQLDLRKSIPVLLAAGLIWLIIAILFRNTPHAPLVASSLQHHFLEYTELFFFLVVAMTYINSMANRGVFNALRDFLVHRGYSYQSLFWLTGILTFLISPIADNLTTVLIMCAVLMAVGRQRPKFIGIGCINIVVAANAGGAFSPFGDITTLMVWQKEMVPFTAFFQLLLPALINFLLPAIVMAFFIPKGHPAELPHPGNALKPGGLGVLLLFLVTIITAVCFNSFLSLPPVFGMLLGFGLLNIFSYLLRLEQRKSGLQRSERFDIFSNLARVDWDTLFFFYGVIICVGGLGFMGYLALLSEALYIDFGATQANVIVGLLSSLIDNIPVMFAVLTMQPEMDQSQWLLVTLTTGVGGSLLSIGSAAGIALMGQARGYYNFFTHLKWTPVVALGYAASVATHMYLQGM